MIEVLMDKYDVSSEFVRCPQCEGEFLLRHLYLFPLTEKFEDEESASLYIALPVLVVKKRVIYTSTSVKGIPEDYYFIKCPLCDTPVFNGFDTSSAENRYLGFKGIEEPQKAKKKKEAVPTSYYESTYTDTAGATSSIITWNTT